MLVYEKYISLLSSECQTCLLFTIMLAFSSEGCQGNILKSTARRKQLVFSDIWVKAIRIPRKKVIDDKIICSETELFIKYKLLITTVQFPLFSKRKQKGKEMFFIE